MTRAALEFARGTFATCSEEHHWYEHFQLLMRQSGNQCGGPDRRLASLPAPGGPPQYLIGARKEKNGLTFTRQPQLLKAGFCCIEEAFLCRIALGKA